MDTGGFYIRGWKAWNSASPDTPPADTPPANVPSLLRRRVTPMGQKILGMAWPFPDAAQSRLILSSRHGEFSRTFSLLESVAQQQDISPADFTLSVHHALIGLLSIAQNNRHGHTAIAAGDESFCLGLMEAVACLREDPQTPVLLLHFDDSLPGAFASFNETTDQPLALVLSLTAQKTGDEFRMVMNPRVSENHSAANPAQDFIAFLQNDADQKTSFSASRQWQWIRHAAA